MHYYQRPDADLPLDPNRTLLTGDAEEFKFGKIGGKHLSFETAYQRRSPGFEVNDLGFLRRADQQSWSTWVGLLRPKAERKFYNSFQLNNNWWQYWTTDGLPLEAAYNTNMHINAQEQLGPSRRRHLGQLGKTYDDRAARGGPAVRQDRTSRRGCSSTGDDRKSIVPFYRRQLLQRARAARNSSLNLSPEINYKVLGRFSSSLHRQLDAQRQRQSVLRPLHETRGGEHYTFAHLDQHTTSVTARLNYTFTPDISLQTYPQPFVSKGTYSNVRQLSSTPSADAYDDRYAAYDNPSVTSDPGGFNFKQLQSNVVFRWEYKPGSTLFAVWNSGRQGFLPRRGRRRISREMWAICSACIRQIRSS